MDTVMLVLTPLLAILPFVAAVAGLWACFKKRDIPGWHALVPFLNLYQMIRIAGRPGWWLLLMLVPPVNLVVGAVVTWGFCRSFGYGLNMTILTYFLPFIGLPIIGFMGDGSADADPTTARTRRRRRGGGGARRGGTGSRRRRGAAREPDTPADAAARAAAHTRPGVAPAAASPQPAEAVAVTPATGEETRPVTERQVAPGPVLNEEGSAPDQDEDPIEQPTSRTFRIKTKQGAVGPISQEQVRAFNKAGKLPDDARIYCIETEEVVPVKQAVTMS